ncbi:hypothetical protein TELCIR_07019 [Teladorsagia circumcincta]|uniref:Spermine/spermidine synthase n=1 Tax=Teladorsagia circumcincta TaxID=45464 RepID=A0A2G9ULE9_TELCI|nr:hypothetical protein TELCIR_07019 [Teladorsagia circumcincta]
MGKSSRSQNRFHHPESWSIGHCEIKEQQKGMGWGRVYSVWKAGAIAVHEMGNGNGYRERIELSDGSVVNVCDIIRIKHGRFYVFRLAEVPLGAHTTLLLKTPKGSMFKDMAIPLARNTQAHTLAIGLGGGAINGMLHHFFPKMDITVVEYDEQMLSMAMKWFELELDEHHWVKLADGIKFIAEEAQQGSLYDIIFLDACDAGLVYIDTLCPVAGFLGDVALRETAQLIGPRGILIVNALSIKLTADELEEFVRCFVHFDKNQAIAKI